MAFIPFQHRPPQKFLHHEMRRFDYAHGSGYERIAHYLDKNKKPAEVVAQVIWDEIPYSKEWCSKYNYTLTQSRFL